MNINELRINNLISHRGLICTVEIINGELDEIYFLGEDFYHWDKPENLEGVPLTEEVLLKFGFDDLGDYGFGIGEFHIRMHSNELYFPISNRKIYIIKVHQLQNLYFALTGKELTSTKAN